MPVLTLLVFVQISKELILVATSIINSYVASDLEVLRTVMFLEKNSCSA